ncbi:MAG TPA: NADH-quinone oxidoreductase subunit M [Bryobacteraceae bacterium]|nr:NADH-quinone oxidoreductase subunit M [Bryobacteraceae bacterium]
MILLCLILIPMIAGVLAWAAARWSATAARWVALVAVLADFALTLLLWISNSQAGFTTWFAQDDWAWIPQFGIRFHLAVDGLSLLLLMLTFFLGALSVLASWNEITEAVGFFHLNLLWILAGIAGVFLAVNLFLFYFAWELMLVPMYFLIAIWGHENRVYAAVKFFIFTQLSGLLMMIAILALFFQHHGATGVYTFEYQDWLSTPMSATAEMWIMLGFFVAFAVKLPVVGLHTWLPDAHTEAPTAGSVILAGLLLKTGAYGMLRFVLPLFPHAAHTFAPIAMALGVAGILYGALVAFGQTDLKRLVAYTSVSHLGFVLLGIFVWNGLALQGALMTMICHGISTGALFILVGALQDRIHTRELDRMGGIWSTAPRLSGAALFFALASLGLPGLGDFVGEFLVLLGTYRQSILLAVLAAIGVLFATFYALRLVQRAFQGPNTHSWRIPDLAPREGIVMALMMVALLWLGLYPRPVLDTFQPAMARLEQLAPGR